ncbi:hypothetical protein KL919_001797 [Ogataea angusta]|nr:hypothetical protein KL919_001797 [Ogataea angusta]
MNLKVSLLLLAGLAPIPMSGAVPLVQEGALPLFANRSPYPNDLASYVSRLIRHSATGVASFVTAAVSTADNSPPTFVSQAIVAKEAAPADDFESWLISQKDFAFKGILSNIGGYHNSTDLAGVAKGAIIASPSRSKPDYFYQWTRDSAVTIGTLIDYLDDTGFEDAEYNIPEIIEAYIVNSKKLQRLSNPSGTFETLEGLGEPKFEVNSTEFTGPWGRPQRDGPALRASTVISYLNILRKYNKELVLKDELIDEETIYHEVVKPDLSYVTRSWYKKGFDLWEEVNSVHLFTSLTQLKALKMGFQEALRFEDKTFYGNLTSSYAALRYFILIDSGFRLNSIPYLIETPELLATGERTGIDAGTIIGIIRTHTFNVDTQDDVEIPFNVDDPASLNTLVALANDMKYRYPINHNRLNLSAAFALGRYPEDIYNGVDTSEGNPWFIATASAAELIYKYIYSHYRYEKDLVIPVELRQLFESITDLKIHNQTVLPFGSQAFADTVGALKRYADAYLAIIKEHAARDGHMSEQFNRYTGFMVGARDLTWSYSSFWSACRWRAKVASIIHTQR